MKFCVLAILALVSLVAALPRYPPPQTRPTAPVRSMMSPLANKPATSVASYAELLTVATSAFSGVIVFYGSSRPSFSSLWHAVRGNSFAARDVTDGVGELWLPVASHPAGHGKCAEGQFWFGPKQICLDGMHAGDFVQPPVGYYCPTGWGFSDNLGCCVPHSPAAITKNDCSNKNGSWDLVRIACVEGQWY